MGYERDDRRDRNGRGEFGRERYGNPGDRGFFDRAGDEVRSWFGDEEAERRRRFDERYDERQDRERGYGRGYDADRSRAGSGYFGNVRSNRDEDYERGRYSGGSPYSGPYDQPEEGRQFGDVGAVSGYGYDGIGSSREGESRSRERLYRAAYARQDRERGRGEGYPRQGYGNPQGDHDGYHDWRSRQIASFDRDYDEYRRENQSRFESEFAAWRQNRQTQRSALGSVKEHQEVVGSDGAHVGTVDHVRGDHILLTKTDRDAGGHHHSIPSSWIATVGETVQLAKTAEEAKRHWTDTEGRSGLFGRDDDDGRTEGGNLNRSFSGTY